jgi:hypothetical protein
MEASRNWSGRIGGLAKVRTFAVSGPLACAPKAERSPPANTDKEASGLPLGNVDADAGETGDDASGEVDAIVPDGFAGEPKVFLDIVDLDYAEDFALKCICVDAGGSLNVFVQTLAGVGNDHVFDATEQFVDSIRITTQSWVRSSRIFAQ